MKNVDENLNDVLDVDSSNDVEIIESKDISVVDKDKNSIERISSIEDAEEDYNLSRNTLHELISAGQEALEGILDVAKNSDSPRAYEVAANTFKHLADCTDKLLELQKKARELDGIKNNKEEQSKTTNNTFFVGTTEELHALLDGKSRGEE